MNSMAIQYEEKDGKYYFIAEEKEIDLHPFVQKGKQMASYIFQFI